MTTSALTAAPGGTIDLIAAVDELAAERWPFLRQRLQDHAAAADGHRVSLVSLQTMEGVREQLAGFARHYPGQDRRAIASLWVQWYVATVWPPLAAASLLLKAEPVLDAQSTALILDDDAKPTGLALPAVARVGRAGSALESLARHQAAPMLDSAAAVTGMSPRVPWSNAINVLGWFLDQLRDNGESEASAQGTDLLTRPRWADGTRNPLDCRQCLAESAQPRRRVCCLRYRLDEFEYCRNCPIPVGRRYAVTRPPES